ncbi:hypothetical protein SDJN03_28172, partial [Cucurbita argyrosperma subsp. sororia]
MLVLFLRMAGTDFMIEEDYTGVSLPRAASDASHQKPHCWLVQEAGLKEIGCSPVGEVLLLLDSRLLANIVKRALLEVGQGRLLFLDMGILLLLASKAKAKRETRTICVHERCITGDMMLRETRTICVHERCITGDMMLRETRTICVHERCITGDMMLRETRTICVHERCITGDPSNMMLRETYVS